MSLSRVLSPGHSGFLPSYPGLGDPGIKLYHGAADFIVGVAAMQARGCLGPESWLAATDCMVCWRVVGRRAIGGCGLGRAVLWDAALRQDELGRWPMVSELAEAACGEGGSAGRALRVAVSEWASAAGISCRKGKTGVSGCQFGRSASVATASARRIAPSDLETATATLRMATARLGMATATLQMVTATLGMATAEAASAV